MIWPIKSKRRLDLPELEPGMLKYPFEAPVLHLGVDTATVFRAVGDDALMRPGFKADVGLCREFEGDAPLVGDRVYSADGLVRVITEAVPVARAGRSPFGASLVYARLDFSSPEPADLDKLKDQIVTLIESDPDDAGTSLCPTTSSSHSCGQPPGSPSCSMWLLTKAEPGSFAGTETRAWSSATRPPLHRRRHGGLLRR